MPENESYDERQEIVESDNESQEEDAASQEEMMDELPSEVSEIIGKLPPEESEKIIKSFQFMGAFNTSPLSPVLKKLNEEHITQIIKSSENTDERNFKFASRSKLYNFILGILGIGVFIFLTIFLAKDSSEIYMDIMKVLFGFLGGFGTGVYYKNKKN